MSGLLSQLAEWTTTSAVHSSGYVGVALLIAAGYLHLAGPNAACLAALGLPRRAGAILVSAGAGDGGGHRSLSLWYPPGLWFGEQRLRGLIERYGWYASVRVSDYDKASELFDRHGGKAVFVGHLIPGMTALISIPASARLWWKRASASAELVSKGTGPAWRITRGARRGVGSPPSKRA